MANRKPTKAELENRIGRVLLLVKILITEVPYSETLEDIIEILEGKK